jgi:hypothetical protein
VLHACDAFFCRIASLLLCCCLLTLLLILGSSLLLGCSSLIQKLLLLLCHLLPRHCLALYCSHTLLARIHTESKAVQTA